MVSADVLLLRYHLSSLTQSVPIFWVALAAIAALFYLIKSAETDKVRAPTVTVGGPLLPKIYSRLTFNSCAPTLISKGYKKYKNTAFKLLRHDGEIVVLPNKYCEELRALPDTRLNALEATFTDHVGDYTAILTGSHLHTDAIQKRLTPAIARILPGLISELNYGFEVDFPECTDWVSIQPFPLLLRLVARAGSRPWVGERLCRNEIWLDASINFMMNIFKTVALLRAFPAFLHPIVSKFLPTVTQLRRQLQDVKNLIVPVINERRVLEELEDPSYEKPDDYLQWMMDLAENEQDADPGNLAHRLLGIMSMAVVPTSAMTALHVLYDLAVRSEYVDPLRAEVVQTLPADWKDSTQADLMGLKKLDSFMRESQRLNPPGQLSFHRLVKQTMTLSDGLKLPAGTHICMPSGPISVDKDIIPDADQFNGLRWFRENKSTATFVSAGPTSLHFGLGRYACPGRYFAAYVLKGILSRILLDCEFKFSESQQCRPKNMIIGDKIAPNLFTEMWFRRRRA